MQLDWACVDLVWICALSFFFPPKKKKESNTAAGAGQAPSIKEELQYLR